MDKKCYNPELWGGIECTINRVDNAFFDQLIYSGHYNRGEADIEVLAQTGISKIRYPILWEKHQPQPNQPIDWRWTQGQLDKLKEKRIDVIAGLVHHGSGPSYVDLLKPDFATGLADYARQVAEQFPHINHYTPVNEPLTTARFSGLYGLWYPHQRSTKTFVQMLLNELKGTVLSMKAIRSINPAAQLVQTEDLGKTYSTPKLKYQARYENERRWLTYDILCGRFDETHKLWKHFIRLGIDKKELHFFLDNPCPPDVFGFNHYLTSERYLDERLHLYPAHTHGGNGRHQYADVEAVRVELNEKSGMEFLIREAWQRYGKPIAITEVHLHCHREEQLRWFRQVWTTCSALKQKGIDIKAVTAWAMLGSYGWNRLLTEPGGDYEPGVFDVRSGQPRATALAHYLSSIQTNAAHPSQLCGQQGWWQRSSRILYGSPVKELAMKNNSQPPLIIIGKNGTLGKAFARVCEARHIPYHLLSRQDCDISQPESIQRMMSELKPWAVINAAGFVRVDDAERECEACYRDNTHGPALLAEACAQGGIPLVSYSSDLVFDGDKQSLYVESDAVNPLNVYGKSKAESEQLIAARHDKALIIRTSAFFSPWDQYNFVHAVINQLAQGESFVAASDYVISPTYVPDLVHSSLDLLVDGEKGIWHLANEGAVTWSELAYRVADAFDLDASLIEARPLHQMNLPARRPGYSALGSEKGQILPSLENALERYVGEKKRRENRKVA